MDIIIPEAPTHFVDDYSITSDTGLVIPVTIDTSLGDSITDNGTYLDIRIAPKPDPFDPTRMTPEEEMKVNNSHVLSVSRFKREIKAPTKVEQEEWQKTLQELGGTVH